MATADGPQSAPATDVPPPLDSRTSNLEGNVFIVGESPEDRARRERKRQLRILNSKAWASEKGNTLQANQVNRSSVSTRAVARFEFEEEYRLYQTATHKFEWR